jgi:hypothetical protein
LSTNETERVEALIDFAGRIMAVTVPALRQAGADMGGAITFLAVQATASGMSEEDFASICQRSLQRNIEFEQAAIDAGVVSANE